MELQLSKAERIVRMWGIPERRLRAWLDAGVVEAKPVGRGRGSLRLMTDASLMDAFLAARLLHDLPMGRVQSCLAAARPRYHELFTVRGRVPHRIVFQWQHTDHEGHVAVAMGPFFRTLQALHRAPAIARVRRGRKPKRWQDEFAQLAAEIGTDLRAAEPGLPAVRETIRAYRATRRRTLNELRVTVPA